MKMNEHVISTKCARAYLAAFHGSGVLAGAGAHRAAPASAACCLICGEARSVRAAA